MHFLKPHCLFLLFLWSVSVSAQVTAPVQASLTLARPYSLRLSDYVQSGTNRISGVLTLANHSSGPSVDQVQVKLRLIIENNSVRISTPETYQSSKSITLTEGVPELLDATDLAEYFDPKNLDFVGLDKSQYIQNGRLPEGFYTFRLEVYEYFRGARLTNQSPGALAWLMLNDPPRWVIPSPNEKLAAANPQNLLFQWLPMHTGSPNAVSGVQYDLSIVELWPNTTQNPNDALNSLSPFYTVNDIDATTLQIGPDAPQLVPGRTYAMRLHAKDPSGFDLFKNNGYSEVISFTFGDACLTAESPTAVARSSKEANVTWQAKQNHTAYKVRYREVGQTTWYIDNTTINDRTITNLNPGKRYEYTVAAQCGTLESPVTEILTFTTPAATRADANCNTPVSTTTSVQKATRTVLVPGEEYTSGKVKLVLDNLQKLPSGRYNGVGKAIFGFIPVWMAVEVTDLAVDVDGEMTKGIIKTITFGVYVIDARSLAQAEGILNYAGTLLNGNPPSEENLTKLQDTLRAIRNLPSAAQNLIQEGLSEIRSGNTTSGKALVQQGIAQAKIELARAANKGGNVIGGGTNGGKDLKPLYGLNITFSNAPNSSYGFDAKTHDQLSSTYEQENGVYIPWKAVESGRTDPVLVTVSISGSRYKRDSITFGTQGGGKLPLVAGKISPVGGSEGTTTEVYALYPTTGSGTQNIAQVNVVGYQKEMHTVVIVPLRTALPPGMAQAIADSLNKIYAQAVAGFMVQVREEVFTPKYRGTISIGGTGMLSAYTASQKEIINEYAKRADFSKQHYYVFVGGTPSDLNIKGYMPLARKFAFIFDRETTAKTIAHELGHGVFHLRHAFDEKKLPELGDNLMSYGNGTRLHKYQWDKVHNKDFIVGLLEDDSSGMSISVFDCNMPFHYRAVKIFEEYLNKFSSKAYAFTIKPLVKGNIDKIDAFTITGTLELSNGDKIDIEKVFSKTDNVRDQVDFLYNCGVKYGYSGLIQYNGLDCVAMWARYKDEQSAYEGPPLAINIIASESMSIPAAFYGYVTGKDIVSGKNLTVWDQVFNSVALLPYSKFAITGVKRIFKNGKWWKYGDDVGDFVKIKVAENLEYLNGWTKEKILALAKGKRPLPTEYLKTDYIAKHLAKFDGGAIRFTKQSSFDKYGTLGPDGGFVMAKSEFDKVITETGGDFAKIEKKLGLQPGDLNDTDVLIAWIKKKDYNSLNLPSGNEPGVNVNWIPGGITSGGVSEAIMDLSKQIPYVKIKL